MTQRPAVFFDRDNTLIEDPGYIDDPEKVRLFADAARAVRRVRDAGYLAVVVTNQSGVARGILTEQRLTEVHDRLSALLAEQGAPLDGVYYCPYLDGPEATVAEYRQASDLRKPNPGMLLRAAADLNIDLARSWMVGNSGRDIETGRRGGCRTILLDRTGGADGAHPANPSHVVHTLDEAADLIAHAGAPGASPTSSDATERLLAEIRDLLDRSTRRRRQQDFSLLRLAASLLQMLAVVVALWGLTALLSGGATSATARFALAIFLQLAALCAFQADRHE